MSVPASIAYWKVKTNGIVYRFSDNIYRQSSSLSNSFSRFSQASSSLLELATCKHGLLHTIVFIVVLDCSLDDYLLVSVKV